LIGELSEVDVNQFASRTEAAESRLEAEEASSTSLVRLPGGFLDFGRIVAGLLENFKGSPPVFSGILEALRGLASGRFESRVEYLLSCVSDDIKDVQAESDDQEERLRSVEAKLKTSRFEDLLTEAAVQAARATSKHKIERLAHVAVAGTISHADDPIEKALEYERHAVELDDSDIVILQLLDSSQTPLRRQGNYPEADWIHDVRTSWQKMRQSGYGGLSDRDARSSLARLQARGMAAQIPPEKTINSPGTEPYALLEEGTTFLAYLAGYVIEPQTPVAI